MCACSTYDRWRLVLDQLGGLHLEVFGVGDRVAEERTRYVMMGALMVAVDAAIDKPEPGER
jgi:hypothetical protein